VRHPRRLKDFGLLSRLLSVRILRLPAGSSQEDAKRAVENAKASAAAAPIEVSDANQAMNELIRRMATERAQQQRVMRSVRMLTRAHQQQH
jgi:hypothetical protein